MSDQAAGLRSTEEVELTCFKCKKNFIFIHPCCWPKVFKKIYPEAVISEKWTKVRKAVRHFGTFMCYKCKVNEK